MDDDLRRHERLIGGDPIVSLEIAEAHLEPLALFVRRVLSNRIEDEEAADSAVDAVLDYVQQPAKFKPALRTLSGYLRMAALGNARNIVAKRRRIRTKEIELTIVEHSALHRNKHESMLSTTIPESVLTLEADELASLRKKLNEVLKSESDHDLLDLILLGVRDTNSFAELLGIKDLPEQERRKIVKREKDRIKKQVQRLGLRLK